MENAQLISSVAADRAAAPDGCRGQQHRQHQHHRLQGRRRSCSRNTSCPVARDQRLRRRATSTLRFIAGLGDDARHERRRHRADRQPARRRARGRRLLRGADAGRRALDPRPARFQINAERHPRRSQRQPGARRRRPDQLRRQRHRHHHRRRRHRHDHQHGTKGKLRIVEFADPQVLAREGDNLYSGGDARCPRSRPASMQGAIERSNVSGVTEMTEMIRVAPRLPVPRHRSCSGRTTLRSTAIQRLGDIERIRRQTDESPLHRIDRHERAGAQRRSHLQQHRQHAHHRLQAAAGRVPGPALPEPTAAPARTPRTRAPWCRSASRSARASRPRRPRAS